MLAICLSRIEFSTSSNTEDLRPCDMRMEVLVSLLRAPKVVECVMENPTLLLGFKEATRLPKMNNSYRITLFPISSHCFLNGFVLHDLFRSYHCIV